jgi:hypothetical protein
MRWLRSSAVALGLATAALAFTGVASAHNGPHWTPQQAAKRLLKNDIEWDSGEVDIVTNATCSGQGHSFIASNGHRVYGRFLCWVKTEQEAPYYVRMTSQPGNNYRLRFLYYA